MKFQVNIEVDETQAGLSQIEIVNLALDALSDTFSKTDAYYDVGVNVDGVVSGLTS